MALAKTNPLALPEAKYLFSDNEAVGHRTGDLTDEMIDSMSVNDILDRLMDTHKRGNIKGEEYFRTWNVSKDSLEKRDEKFESQHRFYKALAVKLGFKETTPNGKKNDLVLDAIHWVDNQVNPITEEQRKSAYERFTEQRRIIANRWDNKTL